MDNRYDMSPLSVSGDIYEDPDDLRYKTKLKNI